MRLNELRNAPGATHNSKRLGRGIGSGKGKTAGKGHKGAKARSGVSINGFEGGQMPLYRRLPKRGFKSLNRKNFAVLNLQTLQQAVDAGKIKSGADLNEQSLVEAGVLSRAKDGIRLLGKWELSVKLNLEISGASEAAIKAVEAAGGSVKVLVAKKAKDEKGE